MEPSSVAPSAPIHLPWYVFPWWSLRLYRMPLVFLLCFLILPLSFLCGWLYLANERQWRAQEAQDLQVYAKLASRIIHEELSRVQELEKVLAAQPALLNAVKRRDREAITASLRLFTHLAPSLGSALVTDATGRPVAAVTAPAAGAPAEGTPPISAEPLPISDETLSRSAVYLYDPTSGEKAVRLSTRLQDGQVVRGALHAHVRLGEISRWLEKLRIEPEGFLYVVDDHGLLVSYPFQLRAGTPKDVSAWPAVACSQASASAIVRFRQGQPERPWTAAAVSVAPFSWRVIAQQPDAAMLRPLRRLAAWLLLIITLLSSAISLVVLRWAHMHHVTLQLLAKQTELLRRSEQQRTRTLMRHQHPHEDNDG